MTILTFFHSFAMESANTFFFLLIYAENRTFARFWCLLKFDCRYTYIACIADWRVLVKQKRHPVPRSACFLRMAFRITVLRAASALTSSYGQTVFGRGRLVGCRSGCRGFVYAVVPLFRPFNAG